MRRYCRNRGCGEELDARDARTLPMDFCPSCRAAGWLGFRAGAGVAFWLAVAVAAFDKLGHLRGWW